ncbi:hypothetical protein GRJ2_002764400 [Grus japonensis]|uniref:Uncharacterized protein n=1 Tax=Grus japonensis TaxID=30415 RepID=A0ABC9XZ22_GRUJA
MVSSGYGRAPHTIAQLHLNIDPRWDKPGDLVTATGFDETLHPVLENLDKGRMLEVKQLSGSQSNLEEELEPNEKGRNEKTEKDQIEPMV